jgi:hypothetical protein
MSIGTTQALRRRGWPNRRAQQSAASEFLNLLPVPCAAPGQLGRSAATRKLK